MASVRYFGHGQTWEGSASVVSLAYLQDANGFLKDE